MSVPKLYGLRMTNPTLIITKNTTREKTANDTWIRLNCHECPQPRLKFSDLCTLCATQCRDKNGNSFFAIRPVLEG